MRRPNASCKDFRSTRSSASSGLHMQSCDDSPDDEQRTGVEQQGSQSLDLPWQAGHCPDRSRVGQLIEHAQPGIATSNA